MRISFDISQVGDYPAGCGHYAASLLHALLELGEEDSYLLHPRFNPNFLDHKAGQSLLLQRHPGVEFRLVAGSLKELSAFWQRDPKVILEKLGNPGLIHANSYYCPPPLPQCALIYTLYDMTFVDHPEWFTAENWWNCLSGVMNAAFFADHVVTISMHSQSRFLHYFPFFPKDRIHVASPASRFNYASWGHMDRPQLSVQSGQFWLIVGTIEPRKNHARVIRAYQEYVRRGGDPHPLLIVGGRGWLTENMEPEPGHPFLHEKIILTGYVSDAELAWLYANCLGFLYPSLEEGFGMPVLEAMSMGAAVITSNISALRDVVGTAGMTVDPLSEASITEAMCVLAASPAIRNDLGRQGAERAKSFSWKNTAQVVKQVYALALAKRRLPHDTFGVACHDWWSFCSKHLEQRVSSIISCWRESEADRQARLDVIEHLQERLGQSEADRQARLEVIEHLQKRIERLEARLHELHTVPGVKLLRWLTHQLHSLRKHT